jgi:RimJ/RimL family protein N-acetyltransferase
MKDQPTLQTKRLLLRPFVPEDAPDVQLLAGDREIAATTLNIPHPYDDGLAEQWISSHRRNFEEGMQVTYAIISREDDQLVGAISLAINKRHERAEMGYWVGKPYWNNGYCTEAAEAILRFGFEDLQLHRIYACHFSRNPASGKIMQKIGMKYEGCLRQEAKKWGAFEDIKIYGILISEYHSRTT